MRLIQKFKERLEISRKEATRRAVRFFFFCACCVAIIVLTAIFFPARGFTEEISLLPGNHVQVEEILGGDVLIDKEEFSEKVEGNTTFVAFKKQAIIYMTKVDGVSYIHEQAARVRLGYTAKSNIIKGDLAIREIITDKVIMIIGFIILPLCFLFLLSSAAASAQKKHGRAVWLV